MRLLSLFLYLLLCLQAFAQQPLNSEQQAWLYRIVKKTPVLDRNWGPYFEFDEASFINVKYGQYETDYDAILQHQISFPESLTIHYDSISQTSPGLLSEAAIKLTLWELNEALKDCLYRPAQCRDSIYSYFAQPLQKIIPRPLNAKRSGAVLSCVMHPSLPLSKKIDQLTQQHKLDSDDQKKLLNRWRQLVTDYALTNSQAYFRRLSAGSSFAGITFLAAGEGSGTAGLLYETELNPEDSTKEWYGKGIGLFTYEVKNRQQTLRPLSHSTDQIQLPANKPASLHISLWGLNSSFKPMIIITNESKSYHLFADFASRELSVDPAAGSGISHLDRIEQYRSKKIEPLLKDLQKEGSLGAILQKEYGIKSEIETNLSRLEAEIDTLQKETNPSLSAIDYRKKLIDTNLTNLTKKERRIHELEQKLSAEYAKIAQAEKKLTEMESLLGAHPLSWQMKGDHYLFEDGVVFNTRTQDLLFPASATPTNLDIQLLSAGYTLEGEQKDEVQMYVSLTDAPAKKEKESIQTEPLHFQQTFFFYPDEYHSFTALPDSLTVLLKKILSENNHQPLIIQATIAPLPDSLTHPTTGLLPTYSNHDREFEQPLTPAGQNRTVKLDITQSGDTLHIVAYGSTDVVPTRLSKVDPKLRSQLGITVSSTQNNVYLSALRALGVLQQVFTSTEKNHEWIPTLKDEFGIHEVDSEILHSIIVPFARCRKPSIRQ